VDTPLQRRMKIHDSPDIAYRDWLRFGELGEADRLPRQWARHYVEHSCAEVHDWLTGQGLSYLPAVNWVERGLQGNGNTLPRYHIVWGTSLRLTTRLIELMHEAGAQGRLQLLHRHEVTSLDTAAGAVCGATALNHADGSSLQLSAPVVVLAMGGINGSLDQVRAHWPPAGPCPLPCSTVRTRLPMAACTGWRPAWAGRSPMPARCGTTPPACRIRSRTSTAMACR
jgi:predicted oxidoreductase